MEGGTMDGREMITELRMGGKPLSSSVERIEVWEDNAGGLYLYLIGAGVVVAGMEYSEDALTDCRLLDVWIDDVDDDNIYPVEDDPPGGEVAHVATFTGDTLRPETQYPGFAARRYCGLWDEE